METLHGLSLGLGSVSAIQQQVSHALEQPVKTAQQYVHQQPVNHVDETGWPEGDKQKWLWINATPEVTVFHIMHPDELEFPFSGNIRFEGMEIPQELLTRHGIEFDPAKLFE